MIRIRRYRLFLAVVIFVLAGAYFFNQSSSWDSGTAAFAGGFGVPASTDQTSNDKTEKPLHGDARPPNAHNTIHHESSTISSRTLSSSSSHTSTSTTTATTTSAAADQPVPHQFGIMNGDGKDTLEHSGLGSDRLESEPQDPLHTAIHWSSYTEHYPVTSTIQLPTGTPVKIPQVQFDFGHETSTAKTRREEKLAAIKASFKRSWEGYRKYAWMHDELRPVSGGHKDPFCGWAATLVDSLDTLWIMGLEEEFEEAVRAVGDIDFTTSRYKNEIPVFETTIRYLGGLLGAYDISGRKVQYKILLDKAVELAEVLMGAFDTPNRMPVMYYSWKPVFATVPHRSSTNTVMAEIGSLSMEFTHLSQLTGEPRYYDAVARITDAFEEFQHRTKLPGMWPLHIDTSGCSGTAHSGPHDKSKTLGAAVQGSKANPNTILDMLSDTEDTEEEEDLKDDWKNLKDSSSFGKEEGEDLEIDQYRTRRRSDYVDAQGEPSILSRDDSGCIDEGFASQFHGMYSETFTLGGMADSTYEYLPKQYLMLGGLKDQYKDMYLNAIIAVKKHLLYRPMIKEDRKILFTGALDTNGEKHADGKMKGFLQTEVGHLNCFVGGMVGLAAKIFSRPDEMEIAEQLTDGCVWFYNITATGIMPESSDLIACDDMKDCPWNQTTYYAALDPYFETRLAPTEPLTTSDKSSTATKNGPDPIDEIPGFQIAKPPEPPKMHRRQLGSLASAGTRKELSDNIASKEKDRKLLESPSDPWDGDAADTGVDDESTSTSSVSSTSTSSSSSQATGVEDSEHGSSNSKAPIDPNGILKKPLHSADRPSKVTDGGTLIHSTYLDEEDDEVDSEDDVQSAQTHEQYVLNRIKDERLPTGVTRLGGRSYILRPEAIESVFYMYRITGDSQWREKGWQMFQSIERVTKTQYGSSGIQDVTVKSPTPDDKMESFWLAETLKYFYLLFSHESLVSLDDWVLNTEAHFFLRPDVATRSDESSLGYPG